MTLKSITAQFKGNVLMHLQTFFHIYQNQITNIFPLIYITPNERVLTILYF